MGSLNILIKNLQMTILNLVKTMVQDIISFHQKYPMQDSLIILLLKLNRTKSKSRKYFKYSNNFKIFSKICKKLNSNMNKDNYIIFKKEKNNLNLDWMN